MAQEVLQNFQSASPTSIEDWKRRKLCMAIQDVILAALYLILLLNVFIVAIMALKAFIGLVHCVLVPVEGGLGSCEMGFIFLAILPMISAENT